MITANLHAHEAAVNQWIVGHRPEIAESRLASRAPEQARLSAGSVSSQPCRATPSFTVCAATLFGDMPR